MKKVCFLILFILLAVAVRAQVFPVTADLRVQPVHLQRLSDLGGFGSSPYPVQVHLLLNDLSIDQRSVTLSYSLRGEGIFVETRPQLTTRSLTLESGILFTVPEALISSGFTPGNLSGNNQVGYTDLLPEGTYEICVEVIDVLSQRKLSNTVCKQVYLTRNEPPLLIFPEKGAAITSVLPQSLMFQWAPRHSNGGMFSYHFSLVEVWDVHQDPQAAFMASPPIFETTTTHTQLRYDHQATPLIPNRRYAWQVRVLPDNDNFTGGSYTNNGRSEIFWFDYVETCKMPLAISHEVKGKNQANISWSDASFDLAYYVIRYRKSGEDNQWFYSRTTLNQLTLWGLEAATEYEYQVLKQCELQESAYSASGFLTTGSSNQLSDLYDCGIAPEMNVKAQFPLPRLAVGEQFRAGDFLITVTEVKGADGRFSGKGVVGIPYLANIRVGVRFTNVYINRDRQLASGEVRTEYDRNWRNMLDIDQAADVAEDIADAIFGDDDHLLAPLDFEITAEAISVEDGRILITAPDGSITEIDHDQGDTVLITDASGDQWQVDANGEVLQVGEGAPGGPVTAVNTEGVIYNSQGQAEVTTLAPEGINARFYLGPESRYAMDEVNREWKKAVYPGISDTRGEDYFPVHKAVISGREEVFYAALEVKRSSFHADSLVVKTMEGRKIAFSFLEDGQILTIRLRGLADTLEEQVLLCYPMKEEEKYEVIGMFYLHHLQAHREIGLSVTGAGHGAVPEHLESMLKSVYGPIGIDFRLHDSGTFVPDPALWDSQERNGLLDYPGSGLLADYPPEFRDFQRHFMVSGLFSEPEDYHLFFLQGAISTTAGIAGFMPPGRQWGYVFARGDSEHKPDAATIALHEIGHGIFGLQHPEDPGATGLLMNQGPGVELTYRDWKVINDNGLTLHWFDRDDTREIGGKTWFTPDWKPFRIPETRVISSDRVEGVVEGAVPGFKVNGTYYHARMGGSGFEGYFDGSGAAYPVTTVRDIEDDAEVYLFQYSGGCGYNRYFKAPYYRVKTGLEGMELDSDPGIEFVARIPCDGAVQAENLFLKAVCEASEDLEPTPEEIEQLKHLLQAAHRRRATLGERTGMPKGEFYHLINFEEETLGEQEQVLEDKLFLLTSLTGINFYVMAHPRDGPERMADVKQLARLLMEGVPELQQGRSVLILAAYNTLSTPGGEVSCVYSGMSLSRSDLIPAQSLESTNFKSLSDLVISTFSALEKPFGISRFYIRGNKEILKTESRNAQGQFVRGLPFIYKAEFYESPYLQRVEELQQSIGALREMEAEYAASEVAAERYMKLREESVSELNHTINTALQEEHRALQENNREFWEFRNSGLGNLREGLLADKEKLHAWFG
ncbi:fibronectin type III domain-containing protein [Robertkochia flava]|uniref:fibronectin type III domain-containing protein n=1 Tax=Robertkochia flava TaxID=3447986 RepID=UPI001CCD988B|nr:fibronectin type III domain-containing protein [Robertkochia marina]